MNQYGENRKKESSLRFFFSFWGGRNRRSDGVAERVLVLRKPWAPPQKTKEWIRAYVLVEDCSFASLASFWDISSNMCCCDYRIPPLGLQAGFSSGWVCLGGHVQGSLRKWVGFGGCMLMWPIKVGLVDNGCIKFHSI